MAFSKTQGKKQETGTGPHLKQQRLEMTFFKKENVLIITIEEITTTTPIIIM